MSDSPDRREGEGIREWEQRLERDWPETWKTLKIIRMVDENAAERASAD